MYSWIDTSIHRKREYFEPTIGAKPLFWGLPTPNMRVWLNEDRRETKEKGEHDAEKRPTHMR
jgi:hypothetical protein